MPLSGLSSFLPRLSSGFDSARCQVLGRRLSLLGELIRRLGRFRLGTGLSFGIQRQFLGGEGDALLVAKSRGE